MSLSFFSFSFFPFFLFNVSSFLSSMKEHVGMFPHFLTLGANLLIIELLQIIEKGKALSQT